MAETPPEIDYEVEENEPDQIENQVESAIPDTEIAASISDIPVDYGEPGVMDFPDAAFGEEDDDSDELPGEGEPDDDDDEIEEEETISDEDAAALDAEVDEPIMPIDDADERAWE
jgi:hypothetical protein